MAPRPRAPLPDANSGILNQPNPGKITNPDTDGGDGGGGGGGPRTEAAPQRKIYTCKFCHKNFET